MTFDFLNKTSIVMTLAASTITVIVGLYFMGFLDEDAIREQRLSLAQMDELEGSWCTQEFMPVYPNARVTFQRDGRKMRMKQTGFGEYSHDFEQVDVFERNATSYFRYPESTQFITSLGVFENKLTWEHWRRSPNGTYIAADDTGYVTYLSC